jgi:hypothetical protein
MATTEVFVTIVIFGNTVQWVLIVNIHTTVHKLPFRYRQHNRARPQSRLQVTNGKIVTIDTIELRRHNRYSHANRYKPPAQPD